MERSHSVKLVTHTFHNSNRKRNITLLDSVVRNRNCNNQATRLVENLNSKGIA